MSAVRKAEKTFCGQVGEGFFRWLRPHFLV